MKAQKVKSWFSRFSPLREKVKKSSASSLAVAVPCRRALAKEYFGRRSVQVALSVPPAMWSLGLLDVVWRFDLFNMLERLIRHLLGGAFG